MKLVFLIYANFENILDKSWSCKKHPNNLDTENNRHTACSLFLQAFY